MDKLSKHQLDRFNQLNWERYSRFIQHLREKLHDKFIVDPNPVDVKDLITLKWKNQPKKKTRDE